MSIKPDIRISVSSLNPLMVGDPKRAGRGAVSFGSAVTTPPPKPPQYRKYRKPSHTVDEFISDRVSANVQHALKYDYLDLSVQDHMEFCLFPDLQKYTADELKIWSDQ